MNKTVYDALLEKGYADPNSEKWIWLPDMLWFNPEKIDYYNNERYDYLNTDGLFLFAKNARGDFYAWNEKDDTVLFCEHDSGSGIVFAPNLESAIFRIIMEFANGDHAEFCYDDEKSEMDEDEAEEYISESEAKTMLCEYKQVFGDIFKSEWIDIINGLVNNGFIDENGFITELQLIDILKKEFYSEKLFEEIDLN